MESRNDVIRGDVRECLANAQKLLVETLIVIEGVAGWRQFLRESPKVGTFGTACGLIAYCKVAPDDIATAKQVAASLANSQLADGAWASPTIAPGVGLTTATCYATLALLAAGWDCSSPELQKAAAWLCGVIGGDGGVGHTKLDASPYLVCAALTLRTLAAVDSTRFATQAEKLIDWFSRAQNADGGFGETLKTDSTFHHTAEAIISLGSISTMSNALREQLKRAGRYLSEKRSLGNNSHRDLVYITSNDQEAMLPHTYQSDGLLLQAEMLLKSNGLYQRAGETATFLVQNQKDGYWVHGTASGKIPSWGIMECVVGLAQFLDSENQASNSTSLAEVHGDIQAAEGILAIATEWASGHGGLSTFNRELCIALARRGERVVCLVPTATPQEAQEAKAVGVSLVSITNAPAPVSIDLLDRPAPTPDDFVPKIVIGHGRITGHYAVAQVNDSFQQAHRIHFIHMAPDEIEWHKDKSDAAAVAEARSRDELGLCQGARIVAAVGPHLSEVAETLVYPMQKPVRVHRFDPGLHDLQAHDSPPTGIQCLVLGRAEDRKLKGIDIAVMAFARLPHPDTRPFTTDPVLVVRGAPPGTGTEFRSQLLKIAKKPIEVVVREYTSSAEHILDDLKRASVVLMPSRKEGFGLVALEALALRRPILVSDQSGFGKLLAEKLDPALAANFVVRTTGDLEVDAATWAQALEFTLRDRKAAFARARELHEALSPHLSWDASVTGLLEACGR